MPSATAAIAIQPYDVCLSTTADSSCGRVRRTLRARRDHPERPATDCVVGSDLRRRHIVVSHNPVRAR